MKRSSKARHNASKVPKNTLLFTFSLLTGCFVALISFHYLKPLSILLTKNQGSTKTVSYLGPAKGKRWIDTQADQDNLRNKPIVLRDAYSTHFKNDDGTVTALFTGFKQNYEVAPGIWEPIDYSLEKSKDPRYDYQTKNGVGIYLSRNGTVARKENDLFLESGAPTLGLFNPDTQSFIKLNNLDKAKVTKDSENNSLVLDGTDVKLIVYAYDLGAREDLILENNSLVQNASNNDLLTLKAPLTTTGKITINKQQLTDNKYELTSEDSLILEENDKTVAFPFPEGHDSKDNPATIRRFLIQEGDTWYLYTSLPVTWLKKLSTSYPVTVDPDFAGGGNDSWIEGHHATYATARSTATNSNPAQGQYNLGQYKTTSYSVYRSVMNYNTDSIPDQAIITQVNWKNQVAYNYSTSAEFNVNIVNYDWSAYEPIDVNNRDAAFDGCLVGTVDAVWINTTSISTGVYYTSPPLDTSWINKTGYTYYCLNTSRDVANTAATGTEYIIARASESATSQKPYLIIIYQPAQVNATAATIVTSSSFSANWDSQSASGANGYTLDVATDSGFTSFVSNGCDGGSCNAKAVGNFTTYSVTSLSGGTTYYYRVRATDSGGGGTGVSSNTISQLTPLAPPATPTANAASSVATTSFSANWSAATGATKYYLDVAKDSGFTNFTAPLDTACSGSCNNKDVLNVTTYAVTGLTGNTTYYYRVRANNSAGTSSSSGTISPLTIPNIPSVSGSSSIASTSFSANWSAPAGGVASYKLDVSTASNFSSFVTGCAGTSCNNKDVTNVTTYSVTGLSCGVTYYNRVRGANATGSSANSSSTITTLIPCVPTMNAVSSVTATGFTGNWSAATGATKYYLDVANDSGFTSYTGAVATACGGASCNNKDVLNVTTYAVTGLSNGTTYYCRVRANNASGTSASSSSCTPSTIPAAPTMNAVSSITSTGFTGNWSAATGATGYYFDVATDSGFTSFVAAGCAGGSCNNKDIGNVTTYAVTGLSNGTTYYCRVRAYNTGGTSTSSSSCTPITIPAAPTANAASNITTTGFSANWSSVAGATSYNMDVATDSGFTAFLPTSCGGGPCENYEVGDVVTTPISGLTAGTTYYYRVRALNAADAPSSNSNTITVSTIPSAPSVSGASNITSTSFSANWNTATGATKYYLDVANDSGFTSYTGAVATACGGASCNNKDVGNVTTYAVTGLGNNTTYYCRVRAYNTGGTSGSSSSCTPLTAPGAPTMNAVSSITATGFTGNWSAPTGATGYRLDVATDVGFTSFVGTGCGGGSCNNKDVGNVTTYAVANLTAGNTYYCRVRAYNGGGGTGTNSSSCSPATIPPTPTATAATNITSTSFSANWNAANGATAYKLDVATDSGFTSLVSGYNNLDIPSGLTRSVTGLTDNTTYYYRVRAYNTGGTSASSSTINLTTSLQAPNAPTATAATSFTTTIFTANWTAPTGASPATGYKLDVSTDINFGSFVTACGAGGSTLCNNFDISGGGTVSSNISALSAGTTYYYRLRAYNAAGTSGNSNTITTYTIPSAPSIGAPSSISSTGFTANWSASTGATGYKVDVATNSGFTSFVGDGCGGGSCNNKDVGNVTSYAVTGLSNGTTYYCRVKAYNASGTSIVSSTCSPSTIPAAPTMNAVSSITATGFTGNWSAPTGATGYYLDVANDSGFTSYTGAVATACGGASCNNKDVLNVTTYAVTGLSNGTTYYCRVRAYNTGGTSTSSSSCSPSTIPAAPVATAPTNQNGTDFSANWNASTGATKYYLDVAIDSGFTSFATGFNNLDVLNVTTYSVTGLTNGTTYYYRVRANNSGGTSGNSNTITLPGAPTATAATSVADTSLSANWNASGGATGYYLDVSIASNFSSFVSGFNNLDAGSATTYSVTGLTGNTPYYYRVRAHSASATSNSSNTISKLTKPSTPSSTPASNVASTSFSANWNAPTGGAGGYYLDVAKDSEFTNYTAPLDTACGGATCYNKDVTNLTTYSVTGLIGNTTYYYQVRAYNATGTSASSGSQSNLNKPGVPSVSASSSITSTSFSANWSAPTGGAASYKLDVSTASDFSSFVTGCAGTSCNNKDVTNVTTYSVTGLSCGTTYYNRVRGANATGSSTSSSSAITTLIPCVPTATAATNIAGTSFSANWNAATGATGYKLDVATDNGFTSFVTGYNNKDIPSGATVTDSVTGLTAGTPYYYRVWAYNSNGTSGNSNTINPTTLEPPPPAPVATAATNVSDTSLSANWNASAGATDYWLDVSTASNFATRISGFDNLEVGNVTTKLVTGLTGNTTYYYRVRASNTGGTSDPSNSITTLTKPSAPTTTAATSVNDIQFTANWSAPAGGAVSYKLSVSTNSACTSAFITSSSCGGSACSLYPVGSVTTLAIAGLSANTTYYYCTKATNATGDSSLSTSPTSQLTAPAIPTALNPDTQSTGQSTFGAKTNITNVTGATSYRLDVATTQDFTGGFLNTNLNYNNLNVTSSTNNTINSILFQAVSGITQGTPYYYRWRSWNGSASRNSSVITVVPQPPTPVAIAATNNTTGGSFTANWNIVSGATGYRVDVAKNDNTFTDFAPDQHDVTVPGGSTSGYVVNTGIYPQQSYYYRVRAVNSNGTISPNSNIIGPVTTPAGTSTYCPSNNTNTTITYSCKFQNTIDGIGNGDLILAAGTTVTLDPGQSVVWTPGKKIDFTQGGTLILTGANTALKQGYISYLDTDGDGYPDNTTPAFSSSTPTGSYRPRYQLQSSTTPDCDTDGTTPPPYVTPGPNYYGGADCTYKKVFITNTAYDGNLGGTAGADLKCQTAADAAGLEGSFKAWISDATQSASIRFGTHFGYKYKLPDNTTSPSTAMVAYNWWDLMANKSGEYLRNLINQNEYGTSATSLNAWTNTYLNNSDALAVSTTDGTTCAHWTSNSSGNSGRIGDNSVKTSGWTSSTTATCDTSKRLICFEQ